MTRKYEIAFLLREGETVEPTVERVKSYLKKANLELLKEDNMGVRDLAYEINKTRERFRKAYYYFMNTEGPATAVAAFEEAIKYDQDVIRHLVTREA